MFVFVNVKPVSVLQSIFDSPVKVTPSETVYRNLNSRQTKSLRRVNNNHHQRSTNSRRSRKTTGSRDREFSNKLKRRVVVPLNPYHRVVAKVSLVNKNFVSVSPSGGAGGGGGSRQPPDGRRQVEPSIHSSNNKNHPHLPHHRRRKRTKRIMSQKKKKKKKPSRSTGKPPSQLDLIYLHDSPSFCERDKKLSEYETGYKISNATLHCALTYRMYINRLYRKYAKSH